MNGRWMIWPRREYVGPQDLVRWAAGILREPIGLMPVDEAVEILHDKGVATFLPARVVPPLNAP